MKKLVAVTLLLVATAAAADDHLVGVLKVDKLQSGPEVLFYTENWKAPEECVSFMAKFNKVSAEPPQQVPIVATRCGRSTMIFDKAGPDLTHTYFVRFASGILAVTEMTDLKACQRHQSMHSALLDTASFCARGSQSILYQ